MNPSRVALVLVMVFGIGLVGCFAPPGPPQAPTTLPDLVGTPVTTVPVPTTPPPVSAQQYEAELRAVGETLSAALHRIGVGAPHELLASELTSAAAEARASARRLGDIVPPRQSSPAQAVLIPALDQFVSGLAGLSAQVRSRELCAPAPVMATISTLPGTAALRAAIDQLGSVGAGLAVALPAPAPLPDRRIGNGTVLRDPGSGYGEFEVQNGTDRDAVLTFAQGGHAVGSLYVARGEAARMDGIPDGSYEMFFTSGVDWDGVAFTRSCAFNRYDDTAVFETEEVEEGVEYTHFSVTLHAVPAGNAEILSIPPESYPK